MSKRSCFNKIGNAGARRALVTVTPAWQPTFATFPRLCLATTRSRARKPSNNYFSSFTPRLKQHDDQSPVGEAQAVPESLTRTKTNKRSAARLPTTTSLRRVAVEAQTSRHGFIKGRGKRRFVDPEAETKDVTASCAAEQYNIASARQLLAQEGYQIDPHGTGLYPQVVHIQIQHHARSNEDDEDKLQGSGDVFVFPSGTVVSWNVHERLQKQLVHRTLLPAAENPHLDKIELEDLEYLEDSTRSNSEILGDTIILGNKPSSTTSSNSDEPTRPTSPHTHPATTEAIDTILTKIAFSSGLARSTKLAVLENTLSSYFDSTRSIPTILSRGSPLRFTRSFILRKTGELLSIRASLNLYSELTDSLPDLFWDSPSSLGLSDYYEQVGYALDVELRIRTLNEKMDYAAEIATVLRERLSEKHSTGLEWLIIFLISIEVGFELNRLFREGGEQHKIESGQLDSSLDDAVERYMTKLVKKAMIDKGSEK